MKILVPIKRVPDPQTNISVKGDGTGIVTDNVKFVINPFCEIALEEALRIKEQQAATSGGFRDGPMTGAPLKLTLP